MKLKGFLREFQILKNGNLKLTVVIWKEGFTQKQVDEIGKSENTPDVDVEIRRLSSEEREKWLSVVEDTP